MFPAPSDQVNKEEEGNTLEDTDLLEQFTKQLLQEMAETISCYKE